MRHYTHIKHWLHTIHYKTGQVIVNKNGNYRKLAQKVGLHCQLSLSLSVCPFMWRKANVLVNLHWSVQDQLGCLKNKWIAKKNLAVRRDMKLELSSWLDTWARSLFQWPSVPNRIGWYRRIVNLSLIPLIRSSLSCYQPNEWIQVWENMSVRCQTWESKLTVGRSWWRFIKCEWTPSCWSCALPYKVKERFTVSFIIILVR